MVESTTVAPTVADRLVHNAEVLILGGTSDRRMLTSHHSPQRLCLSWDKGQPGTRASTWPPGLCFNRMILACRC